MTTYRRVNMSMGGWKWGYPRGHRIGIVRYIAMPDKQNVLRWYSTGAVCNGLKGNNLDYFFGLFPEAWSHSVGSIHRKAVNA